MPNALLQVDDAYDANATFRSDDLWNGRGSIALNCQYGYSQALGNALFDRAGVPPQETAIVPATKRSRFSPLPDARPRLAREFLDLLQ